MQRRTAVVTGGTGGLGLEVARGLLRQGLDVLVVGRRVENGREALADLSRDRTDGQKLSFVQADLSELDGVRRAADAIGREFDHLDVLVNNAGAQFVKREITADGLERTMATNHFSMFLLTALLLDRLRAAPAARILNTASSIHMMARLDPEDLAFSTGYSVVKAYAASKLANVLFTNELARRLAGSGITANSFHPGAVRSNFNGFLRRWWARPFTLTAETAAGPVLLLALSPELAGATGGYYDKGKGLRTPSRQARDLDLARRLWEASEALTGHPWQKALASRELAGAV